MTRLLGLLNDKTNEEHQRGNVGGMSMCSLSTSIVRKNIFSFNSCQSLATETGWVIDSGANQHMVKTDKNIFNPIDVFEFDIKIKHPNGSDALVTKIGSLKLNNDVILNDVFVVPEYCVNLLSVYKLTKDNKLNVTFNESKCFIHDSLTKKTLVTGSQVNWLYVCGEDSNSLKVCFISFNQINI